MGILCIIRITKIPLLVMPIMHIMPISMPMHMPYYYNAYYAIYAYYYAYAHALL